MKRTCETIAVEGGAEGKPAVAEAIQNRIYDLYREVVRYIPRKHRIGWYHALARYTGKPFTAAPTAAEHAYRAWSKARHTNPCHTGAGSPATQHGEASEQGNGSRSAYVAGQSRGAC